MELATSYAHLSEEEDCVFVTACRRTQKDEKYEKDQEGATKKFW